MEHPTMKIQKEIVHNSERVKSLHLHPTEPWILLGLYSGNVSIWNYQSQATEKSFKVADSPVRSAKFFPDKQWVMTGSDDGYLRVYDYFTSEKVRELKAHEDYIRCVAVHPTLPCILTASDDKSIKLWNWDKDWICSQTFEGHSHYVFDLAFNPKDHDEFASASLDGTLKIWSVGSPDPKFTIDAHPKGVNCVEYSLHGGDGKLYLLSGSDDYTAKVWDYEAKNCIHTIEGHEHNVTAICVHPELPVVITSSEDKTVRVWSKATKSLEKTYDFGLGRVWAIGYIKASGQIVFACDDGHVMAKILTSGESN